MKKTTKVLMTSALVLGFSAATLAPTVAEAAKPVYAQSADTTAKINALIKEKQELIMKKKFSKDWREQKALGMRISEIEREIQALKKGQSTGNNGGSQVTPPSSNDDTIAQINALIKQKQELINKKKVSRDKKEQKELGKQIDQIEKQIKELKKAAKR